MINLLKNSLVSIQTSEGKIVGAGFLADENLIVTCAHVVRSALKLKSTPELAPDSKIFFDFPFVAPGEVLKASVVYWEPKKEDGTGDIAGLKFDKSPPRTARPVQLIQTEPENIRQHPFSAFGFPKGQDQGAWAYGVLRDDRPGGTVQLEDIKSPGKPIEGGFSGGPVWDDELRRVVGMITTSDTNVHVTKVAYIIPVNKIAKWELLEVRPDHEEYSEIKVVIVSMVQNQAQSLLVTRQETQGFRNLFTEGDIREWLSNYKDVTQHWIPHIPTDDTILDIMNDMIDEVNYLLREDPGSRLLRMELVTDQFFDSANEEAQEELWEEMIEFGGIIIIDMLSLFHPDIQDVLKKARVDSHKNVAVLAIAPVTPNSIQANELLYLKAHDSIRTGLRRFAIRFDEYCEIGINNSDAIDRWLFRTLPKIAEVTEEYQSNPENLRIFRHQRSKKKRGYGKLIKTGIGE